MRTFIAVDAPPHVRQAAGRLIEQLSRATSGVRWVAGENMHFTLKFLGEVEREQTHAIGRAVKQAVAETAPFVVTCGAVGAFPSVGRPRTVWLGLSAGAEAMARLHKTVDRAMRELRFPREDQKFHPHLTIGRVRRAARNLPELLRQHADTETGQFTVRDVVVYQSDLKPSGPIYTPLARANLCG